MDTQQLEDDGTGPLSQCSIMTSNPYLQYTWIQLHDALIEKEYQLQCATDELCKLSLTEAESNRKDGVIAELRKEIAAHRKNSSGKDISYVSMEEHLASCESHLREKTGEAVKLRKEISEVHQQLQSATSLSSSLKKQLSSKNSAMSCQAEDIRRLHQQVATATELTASLRQECKDKQHNITSLHDKVKRLKQTNQDFQKRLEDSQTGEDKLAASERRSKTELMKVKGDVAATKQLQARCNFLEAEVGKAKERENNLACALQNKRDELSNLCQRLLAVTSQRSMEPTSNSPDKVLSAVSRLVNEQAQAGEKMLELDGELKEAQQNVLAACEDVESLKQCFSDFKDSDSSLDIPSTLESAITGLHNLHCESQLNELKANLTSYLQSLQAHMAEHVTNWTQISQKLALGCKSLEEDKGEGDPFEMVSFIVEMAQSKTSMCQQMNERLSQSELEHRAALSGAVAAIKQDEEARLTVEIERVKQAEQERHVSQLKELQQHLEEEKNTALAREQGNTKAVMEELAHSKKLLVDTQTEIQEKKDIERKVVSLEDELKKMVEGHSQAMCVAEAQRVTVRQQLLDEVSSYKEQSQQYALTIVALEEKLLILMEKCQALDEENRQLQEQFDRSIASTVEPTKDATERMQKLVDVLRHQLTLASKEELCKQAHIQQLKEALQLARTDLQEQVAALKEQYSAEVQDLKRTLTVQEGTIESQKQETARLRQLLQVESEKKASREVEHRQLLEELSSMKLQGEATEQQKTGKELMMAGDRCLGERHDDVIGNQREAITKLKEELNIALLASLPAPTHQATLKELSRVRGELLTARTECVHEGQVESGREGIHGNDPPETSLQTCDLMDILHSSEQLYDSLVDTVCERLSIQKPTSGSMIPPDKAMYKQVFHNRQKFCEKVAMLMKTDSQSEHSHSKHHRHTASASNDSTDDSYSSHCSEQSVSGTEAKKVIAELEAELSLTAEALDQQKRLNQALIRRKIFKEVQSNEASSRLSHNCFSKTQD